MKFKGCVTFFTTDYPLHNTFFYPIGLRLLHEGYIPIYLISGNVDMFDNRFPFSRIFLPLFVQMPFDILKPIAHVQMQDHDRYHRHLQSLAKENGVKTFHIQHGYVVKLNGEYDKTAGFWDTISDYICLWEKDYIQPFMERGIAQERLYVTGNPRYDMFPPRTRKEIKNVILTTTATKSTDGPADLGCDLIKRFNDFLDVVEEHPELNFYIKQHPTPFDETKTWLDEIRKRKRIFSNIKFIDRKFDFFSVLSGGDVDCLFYSPSSTGCDAVAYGIPIISLFEDVDLKEELNRVLRGEPPKSFQYPDLIKDRQASSRIVKLIIGE